jgi:Zn-dependent M28 family amino/carboxypeptidase
MGVQLAKWYAKNKPKHTRLVFLSFDAEEICLKGSREFFRGHRGEFNSIKTWHFNVDCPYAVDELKFLTRDVNGFVRLSARLAGKLVDIARDLGYADAKTTPIMFLGGGTDAGEAARAGIEATTLIGMPFGPKTSKGRQVVYHTHLDTIDAVEPEIVKATMEVFGRFVAEVDNGRWPL